MVSDAIARPVEKLTVDMCPADAPPIYTADQIAGKPTGEGGDEPVMNLYQLIELSLAAADKGIRIKRRLERRGAAPWTHPYEFKRVEHWRNTFERLVDLMPSDFIDGTTDAYSHT